MKWTCSQLMQPCCLSEPISLLLEERAPLEAAAFCRPAGLQHLSSHAWRGGDAWRPERWRLKSAAVLGEDSSLICPQVYHASSQSRITRFEVERFLCFECVGVLFVFA